MNPAHKEQTRFWQASALGDTEMLHARYFQQRFAPHVHEGYVITIIESGAQRFWHRGSEHLAPVGSMVLINPDELHTGAKASEDGWRYRGFYPDCERITGVLDELELKRDGLPRFDASVLHDPQLAKAFSWLHCSAEQGASALEQQTAWREAVLLLVQRHARSGEARAPGNEPGAVTRAKELMDSRLAYPPSLEELATAVNLSPFHFARVFRQATGLPPHAWLKQRRLSRARELLKNDCLPFNVAFALGFADQSHLNRQFKQAYGVTPGEYRRACTH
ncbi:AraC family transcriptional regulator [Pseudomonas rubra]|uniref:AraC family transcriptional regulator n=1 Tax=Pseudomonas rubra TaxID=2942627 RepID=A0ABT5PBM7_9PSED|nr:AraC family transcriptional regulator [Pseudomonas rubra]MDD1015438.1 AraC family transcriptional regulator [Pseudomonas rubra]MDD1041252.1 AraC family transcriptional regulator [Pseudomonas rubra]MDD1153661.1 AraC family transcriptional regulator [Pseudomonas rubra]